ncbi:MAG: selB, partial [Ilumatobacteraceae bacterium]|nr:selB [Ilumatobacteraceae bacterium]
GMRLGVIALSKVDLVDDEWRDLQALDIADRVEGTFLEHAPIVAVSAVTGAGFDELRSELDALLTRTPPAADNARPRLWVDRSFAAKGSGTVVTGTLTGGALLVDQRVDIVPAGRTARIRSIQQHGVTMSTVQPGTRVALNLAGVDHHDIVRGDAIVAATQWRPTQRFDATLDVLAQVGHVVSRRGAYQAYIGSGEWPVKVRVLGPDSIKPGQRGLVRLHLASAIPLLPGDRYVLRESGRDETIGGGEVLDVAPVLPASKARPDRDIDRVIAERGWTDVDELEALTGQRRPPTIGHWVVGDASMAATVAALNQRLTDAGAAGIDMASLDDRDRAVVATLADLRVDGTTVRAADVHDPVVGHPVVQLLRLGGLAPPDVGDVDRATIRELVRRGVIVQRDGICFHRDAIDAAADTVAGLLRHQPDGVTMSQLRDSLGVSRKYALPIAAELDARAVTRRRGDLRIAGPHLPGA